MSGPGGTVPPPAGSTLPPDEPGPAAPSPAGPRAQAVASLRAALSGDPTFAPHAGIVFDELERLGEGGMGVVHRVRDRRLGREAALKTIRGQVGAAAVLRFRREVEVTARLDHPSIPPVYEAGTDEHGQSYMLMRVVEGEPLSERIAQFHSRGRKLRREDPELRTLLEALLKVSEAVAYAHSRGVIHRDLKPDNVMLGQFGEVLLLDWGLAKTPGDSPEDPSPLPHGQAADDGLTQAGAVLGTPGYMPPEQANGEEVDARADVFSLGAILVEVLTGEPPVRGKTALKRIAATAAGAIQTPRMRRPDAPRELDSVARKALAAHRASRYPTAEALLRDLRAFLAGGAVTAHRYGLRERLSALPRRRPGVVLALAALVVGAVVAGLGFGSYRITADEVDAQITARGTGIARAISGSLDRSLWVTEVYEGNRPERLPREEESAVLGAMEQGLRGLVGGVKNRHQPGGRLVESVMVYERTGTAEVLVAQAPSPAQSQWYMSEVLTLHDAPTLRIREGRRDGRLLRRFDVPVVLSRVEADRLIDQALARAGSDPASGLKDLRALIGEDGLESLEDARDWRREHAKRVLRPGLDDVDPWVSVMIGADALEEVQRTLWERIALITLAVAGLGAGTVLLAAWSVRRPRSSQ